MYLDYPLVYIASDDCGFRILNVSNPVNPVTVFYGDLGGSSINTIKIQDDYAYLANNSGDLMVMDISNLSTPAIIDTFPFPGEIEDLALIGDTLYLVNMERVYALSIAIPDTVTIMGYYDTPGIATGVAVDTGIVVVADCFSLRLYQYEYPNAVFSYNEDIPKSYCLSPVNPNPFNYQTQLNFDISQPGKVTITVYNLNGRQVMEIAQGYYFPGEYTINWNAEDLASGLYLVELKQNGYSAVQKAVLLK
jgi:WD40 repeat protein